MPGSYEKPSANKVCVLFSGGKDSTYAVHWATLKGFRVSCLVTVKPESPESYMFHFPYIDLTRLQAEAMELPQVFHLQKGEGDLEALQLALRKAVEKYGCSAVVTGALRSDYQRMRVVEAALNQGLKVYNPLWWRDQESYLRTLVSLGFRFIITSATVKGLDPRLIGKEIDLEDADSIIQASRVHGFNPAFEGGEAETLVTDAPLFRRRLKVTGETVRRDEYTWIFQVREARLVEKYSP